MVEHVVQRLPNLVDPAVVDEKTGLWMDGAFNRQLDLETVPVQPRALMAIRHLRQTMGSFWKRSSLISRTFTLPNVARQLSGPRLRKWGN